MTDSALSASGRAARIGRILFRREPGSDEVAAWSKRITDGPGDTDLIKSLVDSAEFQAIAPGESQQIGRACDAVMDRYDASLPRDVAHFVQLKRLESKFDLHGLIDQFATMRTSGYRYDPCASPVDPSRPMRLALDADGNPLIFTIGTNGHLYLFCRQSAADGAYAQIDLSDLLPQPAHGKVLGFDVRQDSKGTIALAVALGPRAGVTDSALYAGLNLSNAMDAQGWRQALPALRLVPGAPDKTVISNVTLSANDGAPLPLLLIGAAQQGGMDDYLVDFDQAPGPWKKIRLPEDATRVRQLTLGRYRQPGWWVLYDAGPATALTFSAFPDGFGKTLNLSYTALPAHATVMAIQPGSADPAKPDVFVGGDGLVVYRSTVDTPQTIVPATASRGISYINVQRAGGVEHLWFVDDSHTLKYMTMEGGQWQGPAALTSNVAGIAFIGAAATAPAMVVITASRTLELRSRASAGGAWSAIEIATPAVWDTTPLTAQELAAALEGAAPVLYADEQEIFHMSSVDDFLSKVGLWSELTQAWQYGPGQLWDPATADLRPECVGASLARSAPTDPKHDSDYVLKIPDAEYTTSKEGHPYGDLVAGKPARARVYVHAKFNPAANATDLALWTFYPYNGAGTLKLEIGGQDARLDCYPLGIHEGDWEHVLLRIDNDSKQLVSVYLSQHDSGAMVAPDQLERDAGSGRVVLYMSRHGHAFYQQEGDNLSKEKRAGLYHIGLVNHCSKGTRINTWEAGRSVIVSAGFLGAQAPAEPQWLQLPWRWGRYHELSGAEVSEVLNNALGGPMGALIKESGISTLIGDILVAEGTMGDEGHSAGPGAPKFKGNWFGAEED